MFWSNEIKENILEFYIFFNFGDLDLCKEVDLYYILWNYDFKYFFVFLFVVIFCEIKWDYVYFYYGG